MSEPTIVRCRTADCKGVLGAFRSSAFYPSAHLVGGRDWYIALTDESSVVMVRCSMCGEWHEASRVGRHIIIRRTAA